MAEKEVTREVYQFHILLLKISPAIWRRVLVPCDQNLADFHDTIQIVMGWDDTHLHRFRIHGKEHGIAKLGGPWFSSDPRQVQLRSLHLRIKERFLYEYDFHAFWQHQIRLEKVLPLDPTKTYPVCIGGARKAPPYWCDGPFAYLEEKQYFSSDRIGCRLLEILEDEEARVGDYREEAVQMLFWLEAHLFDRQAVNHRLALFAAGDARWLETENVEHVEQVATRIDGELGDEQSSFIEGCPAEWEELLEPAEPIVMGIDGGYVHAREGKNRKAGSFEIIVGKSMGGGKPTKRFGFVNTYDTKPKRRVYEVLKSQGMQMNQQVIFLSDGGDDVRNLQLYLNPYAEYLLDWFHITMRLTVLGQLARGVALQTATFDEKKEQLPFEEEEEPLPSVPTLEELERQLERIKWYLWHGNTFRALQIGEGLEDDLEILEGKDVSIQKMFQAVREFNGYITANESYVVNYGDRYRNGETISTAFVESTVNEVISKRFVKKQQMRWTKKGAHNLLQVRIQVLNDDLHSTFRKWYSGIRETPRIAEYDKAA